MAVVRLCIPIIVATISLALLLDVSTLSWATENQDCTETEVKKAQDLYLSLLIRPKKELTPHDLLDKLGLTVDEFSSKLKDKPDDFLLEMKTKIDEISRDVKPKVDEFLDKLNELNAFFQKCNIQNADVKNEIETLISWSTPDKEKCESDIFIKELFSRINQYASYPWFRIYSEYHGYEYLLRCTHYMDEEMARKVETILDSDKEDMGNLEVQLNKALPMYCRGNKLGGQIFRKHTELEVYHEQLIQALNEFLSSRVGKQSVRGRTTNSRCDLYEDHVIGACKGWVEATARRRDMDGYTRHLYDRRRYADAYSSINNGDICGYIYRNEEKIRRDLEIGECSIKV